MKKAFLLLLLFGLACSAWPVRLGLFGLACAAFAVPLKVDPGTGYAATTALTFAEVSQGVMPAAGVDTDKSTVSILTATALSVLAVVLVVFSFRRKPKSPLLRMRGAAANFLKNTKETFTSRLFAHRAKSVWLKSQGSSDRMMLTA